MSGVNINKSNKFYGVRASEIFVKYEDLFELNYKYYRQGYEENNETFMLNNINYFINALLGGIMKLRFDNTKGFMIRWLNKRLNWLIERGRNTTNVQIALDYLKDIHRRWTNLQLVIPKVELTEDTIDDLQLDIDWLTDMIHAVATDDKSSARVLHEELFYAIRATHGDIPLNFPNIFNGYQVDYLHIIAQNDDADGHKDRRTVNLNMLLGNHDSWQPVHLIFDTDFII